MPAFRKIGTFAKLTLTERRLALEAIYWHSFVRVGLWVLPFRVMQTVCDRRGRPKARHTRATVQEIAWSVRLASRYVPHATCLTQALAARILLGRRGLPAGVHIGVARDASRGFEAHAWAESEGVVVCGGSEAPQYTPILVRESGAR